MTKLISIDVEASGPCPNHGDLLSFGCVLLDDHLDKTYLSPNMKAECANYKHGVYEFLGITREEHEQYPDTIEDGILSMRDWLATLCDVEPYDFNEGHRFIMVSDNPGFDFGWLNFECHNVLGFSPFGHSARRIGDAWAGIKRNPRNTGDWRKYRKTPHDHNPLNDAMGNAEAWQKIWELAKENK